MTSALHATIVLIGPTGVLIRGESGSGKSQLALSLIARGARLVADDRAFVWQCHGRLLASPPAVTAGRMEVRGRGLLSLAFERWAVLRLLIDLVEPAMIERLPEEADLSCTVCGVRIARQPVAIGGAAAPLLVEFAARAAHDRPGAWPLHSP